jgi:hypothetical protein
MRISISNGKFSKPMQIPVPISIFLILFGIAIFFIKPVFADIPVAILPFSGENKKSKDIETILRSSLAQNPGISILADADTLKEIQKIHEKAQAMGSTMHDITKIKAAEFIVSATLSANSLDLKVLDVNTAKEIFNQKIVLETDYKYQLKSKADEIYKLITLNLSELERPIPDEGKEYFELAKKFVEALGSDSQAREYTAFYKGDAFKKPDLAQERDKERLRDFLRVVKPQLIRSKIFFLGIKFAPPRGELAILAKKMGKKTRHQLTIMELNDGTLAVTDYRILE